MSLLNVGKKFFIFCILTSSISYHISANKALEIAILNDQNNNGFIDSSSDMTMNLINRKGDVVSRKLRFKRLEVPEDGDKSIAVFESPRDVKGVAILSYAHKVKSDDQWLYLPALKRVKRIASKNKSGPFLGSEFSFEDFSFQEVEKYEYKLIGEKFGIPHIESGPLVRSSYHAKDSFASV